MGLQANKPSLNPQICLISSYVRWLGRLQGSRVFSTSSSCGPSASLDLPSKWLLCVPPHARVEEQRRRYLRLGQRKKHLDLCWMRFFFPPASLRASAGRLHLYQMCPEVTLDHHPSAKPGTHVRKTCCMETTGWQVTVITHHGATIPWCNHTTCAHVARRSL